MLITDSQKRYIRSKNKLLRQEYRELTWYSAVELLPARLQGNCIFGKDAALGIYNNVGGAEPGKRYIKLGRDSFAVYSEATFDELLLEVGENSCVILPSSIQGTRSVVIRRRDETNRLALTLDDFVEPHARPSFSLRCGAYSTVLLPRVPSEVVSIEGGNCMINGVHGDIRVLAMEGDIKIGLADGSSRSLPEGLCCSMSALFFVSGITNVSCAHQRAVWEFIKNDKIRKAATLG